MQTHSFLQRRANTESSDRVVAHIKPRSWGDEHHEQPQTVQPQNTGFDFKNADWFSHDPGPRSPVRVFNTIQARLTVGAPNDQYEQEADSPGETLRERAAEQVVSTPDSATQQPIQQDVQTEPVGYNFSHVDWFSHDPGPRSPVRVFNTIQAKLKVGAPNDVYEQEADRVAEQVMSTPDASVQHQPEGSISSGNNPTIQCEEDQALASAIDQGKAIPDTLSALKDITYGKTADSAVSTGMNVAGAALDFGANKAAGQSTGEAFGGAAGSFAASELVEYSPVDSTVKAANSVAKALGAPEAVTNSTQVASDMMPSSVMGSGLSNLGRGIFNAVTGNTKALDKQFTDVADGKSGAVFQGYALAPQVAAGIATGDAESAFLKVGSQGKNSPIAKIGGWLGEKAYELLHKDESVQPKLTVEQRGDQYEQEVDRMAEQVTNTPETATQPSVQREATEDNQTKPSLQCSTDGSLQADSNLEGQLNSSRSGGSPLPDEVRSFMEPRFGADFSQVRVHTGSEAVQMNRDLNAQAFTHKQDVYFGSGKYNPSSSDGKHLLAHELTHVVQQTGVKQRQATGNTYKTGVTLPELPNSIQNSVGTSVTVQREGENEDKPFWDNGFFKLASSAAGLIPGPIGMAAKVLKHPFGIARGAEAASKGDRMKSAVEFGGAAKDLAGAAAAADGFSVLAGSMPASAAITGGGLPGAAALGPAAAVAGAGLAGFAGGNYLAEHTKAGDWATSAIAGIDHAITGDGKRSALLRASEWFEDL